MELAPVPIKATRSALHSASMIPFRGMEDGAAESLQTFDLRVTDAAEAAHRGDDDARRVGFSGLGADLPELTVFVVAGLAHF